MNQPEFPTGSTGPLMGGPGTAALARPQPASLADVLERVLDKGIVIAGDIRINLVDVELLTIRVRLLVASVDRAKEMGIDWWEHDPMLSPGANTPAGRTQLSDSIDGDDALHQTEDEGNGDVGGDGDKR